MCALSKHLGADAVTVRWADSVGGVGAGGARESLTRSTQSTKTLSSLTTGDMTAGEREELLSGMRGSPGTLSTLPMET